MKHTSPVLFVTAVALWLAGGGAATAGPVWSVDWPSGIQIARVFSPSHRNELDITFHSARGDASTPTADVADMVVVHHGRERLPMGVLRQRYNLGLRLTDLASGERETMHFSGFLEIIHSRNRIEIKNVLTSPGRLTDIELGNNRYTFSLGPFDPPDLLGTHTGSLDVTVTYQAIQSGPPPDTTPTTGPPQSGSAPPGDPHTTNVQATPEPPAVLLGVIGFGLVGAAGWRKRKGS